MPLPEKPYFVQLAEREMFAALSEWYYDAACTQRELTPVEERLFRSVAGLNRARQQTSSRKESGVHRRKIKSDPSGL